MSVDKNNNTNNRIRNIINNAKTKLSDIVLFEQKKVNRNTFCRLFADGSLFIQGPLVKAGLTIPTKLFDWLKLPEKKTDIPIKINVELSVLKEEVLTKIGENIPAIIYNNDYRTYINIILKANCTSKLLPQTIVRILFKFNNEVDNYYTSLFIKSRKVISRVTSKLPKEFTIYSFGKKSNLNWILYKTDTNQLYLEISGLIDNKGQISLSNELDKYINNWFKFEKLYFCWNTQHPKVVQSKIHQRENKRRKILKFSKLDSTNKAYLLICMPELELSEKAIKDRYYTDELKKHGLKFIFQKANMRSNFNHWDKTAEKEIQQVLKETFPESKFTTINESQILFDIDNFPFKTDSIRLFDKIIYPINVKLSNYVFLCEIKTSMTLRHKSANIDNALAFLLHYKEILGCKKIIPILIMNQDLYYGNKLVTFLSGLISNVLIIGNQKLNQLISQKLNLSNLILKFIDIQSKKLHSNLLRINPKSLKVVMKSIIEQEAINYLKGARYLNSTETRKAIRKYCYLMGIPTKTYFDIINEKCNLDTNNESIYTIIREIHDEVSSKGSAALLQFLNDTSFNKDTYEILVMNEELLNQKITPFFRLYKQMKIRSSYEEFVFQKLTSKNYDVASNIVFHFYGRSIEIDHLAIKSNKILVVSCKDLRKTKNLSYLINRIKFSLYLLELRMKQLNLHNAYLFIKIDDEYKESILNQSILGNSQEGISIFID